MSAIGKSSAAIAFARRVAWATLLVACVVDSARAQVTVLTAATVTAHTFAGDTKTEAVVLPYNWDRAQGGAAGVATIDVPFEQPVEPRTPLAMYISRLGNAYSVELNGVVLQEKGDLELPDTSDFAKAPRFVDVPSTILRQHNLLRIRIRGDSGRRAGVTPVFLGPEDEVFRLYERDFTDQIHITLAVMVLSSLVATMALLLWVTQKERGRRGKRDTLYLFVAIAELSWAVRLGNLLIEEPPLSWRGWSMLMAFATAMWGAGMMAFCCEVAGWRHRAARAFTAAWWALPAVGMLAANLSWLHESTRPLSVFYLMAACSFVPFALFMCRSALQDGAPTELKLLTFVTVVNVCVALRDALVMRFSPEYGTMWLRYSSVLFGFTLGYVVILRYRAANAALDDLLASLSHQVQEKERELHASYAQLNELAREQERMAERGRILRDMHDGVGAHISTAMRQLQSGRAEHGDVVATLRDALEQLKLSIDALNLPAGDINALLAGLRYRLEPRFAASDIELVWEVEEIAPLKHLDGAAMRHLQFMLFEAMSNVLQHAGATSLSIQAHGHDEGARLRIVDNGRGFHSTGTGKGLRTIRERASLIGARLHLESREGGTVLEIVLAA